MVPSPQDRAGRGPLAALLILVSLFLGSATAAAGSDLRGPSARPASSRTTSVAALSVSGTRNTLEDEASGAGAGSAVLPSRPDVVTEILSARPRADAACPASAALPRPACASYRARAPPAS